jgi:hypothetical protein
MSIPCAYSIRLAANGFSFEIFEKATNGVSKRRLSEVAERARHFLTGAELLAGAPGVIGPTQICEGHARIWPREEHREDRKRMQGRRQDKKKKKR